MGFFYLMGKEGKIKTNRTVLNKQFKLGLILLLASLLFMPLNAMAQGKRLIGSGF